jgi:F0F1-type ATP synthase assembly protein I
MILFGLGTVAAAFQVLRIASDATIQANALKGSCGRVFAVYDIVFNSAFLVGLMVGLVLGENLGPGPALVSVVPFFVLGGATFSVMRRSPAAFSDTRGTGHPTTHNRMVTRPSL